MSTTRLLILGILRFSQPSHGYEVRRELESWHADEWANVAYGSIYFALRRMAEEGLIEVVADGDAPRGPARVQYAVTTVGEIEFHRLLHEHWWIYREPVDPFAAAAAFMDDLPKQELIDALHAREAAIRGQLAADKHVMRPIEGDHKPRHVVQLMRLLALRFEAELTWLEETIALVEAGDLP